MRTRPATTNRHKRTTLAYKSFFAADLIDDSRSDHKTNLTQS